MRTDLLQDSEPRRFTNIERSLNTQVRIERPVVPAPPEMVAWGFGGKTTPPTVSASSDWTMPTDGDLVGFLMRLKTAGTTTTTAQLYLDDTILLATLSLAGGERLVEIPFGPKWAPRASGLEVRCTAVGAGALGLSGGVFWLPVVTG